jgi:hypothetical protein
MRRVEPIRGVEDLFGRRKLGDSWKIALRLLRWAFSSV